MYDMIWMIIVIITWIIAIIGIISIQKRAQEKEDKIKNQFLNRCYRKHKLEKLDKKIEKRIKKIDKMLIAERKLLKARLDEAKKASCRAMTVINELLKHPADTYDFLAIQEQSKTILTELETFLESLDKCVDCRKVKKFLASLDKEKK